MESHGGLFKRSTDAVYVDKASCSGLDQVANPNNSSESATDQRQKLLYQAALRKLPSAAQLAKILHEQIDISRAGTDASVLSQPIESLQITTKSLNCLMRAQFSKIGDFALLDISQIVQIKNLASETAEDIAKALNELRLIGTHWDYFL